MAPLLNSRRRAPAGACAAAAQMGVVLLGVELHRKNKEDAVKKEKEAAERQAIRDLHERHLRAEKASCCMEVSMEQGRGEGAQMLPPCSVGGCFRHAVRRIRCWQLLLITLPLLLLLPPPAGPAGGAAHDCQTATRRG